MLLFKERKHFLKFITLLFLKPISPLLLNDSVAYLFDKRSPMGLEQTLRLTEDKKMKTVKNDLIVEFLGAWAFSEQNSDEQTTGTAAKPDFVLCYAHVLDFTGLSLLDFPRNKILQTFIYFFSDESCRFATLGKSSALISAWRMRGAMFFCSTLVMSCTNNMKNYH